MSVLSLIPEEKRNCLSRRESTETVYSGATVAVHPVRVRRVAQPPRADRVLTQRVVSAKTHRIKLLQNQLADAQFHLVELNNENRLLRGLQKKQEVALDRLEKSSSSLPSLVTARDEESRANRVRLSDARRRLRDVTRALARRDRQLQTLQDEHQHLLQLSNDKNLLEREKLQSELNQLRVQSEQQAEQLVVLQRQLALQEKNHRRQLLAEMAKHRDTRHDLDLAISNADKLNSIIEMKEKYITNAMVSKHARAAMGAVKVPRLPPAPLSHPHPRHFTTDLHTHATCDSAVSGMSEDLLSKFSDNSRTSNLNSSNDLSTRPRSVSLVRNNLTRSITPHKDISKKPVKEELSKTIQEGMSDLKIYDDEIDFTKTSEEDVQKRIDQMKVELMKKLKSDERNNAISSTTSSSRKSSGILKKSPELSPEHWPRNKSAQSQNSRRSSEYSVEFIESDQSGSGSGKSKCNFRRETSSDSFKSYSDRIIAKKSQTNSKADVDSYCQNIIQDIEKSNKMIDLHVQGFSSSRKESKKLIEDLQVLDKMNGFVNSDMKEGGLVEVNNNIDDLSTGDTLKTKRLEEKKIDTESIIEKPGKRPRPKLNSFGDSSLSNQDLLDDLLGKK